MARFLERDSLGRVNFGPLEYAVQLLILLSLVSFALETLPDLTETPGDLLRYFELLTIAIFTIEYLARLALSRPRKSYATSFLGIVDLFAILPFYVTGMDLRSLRAFRLMRLFRILKLARYSAAIQRMTRALTMIKEELVLFGAVALVVIYLSAVGIYQFENEAQPDRFTTIFDSLWWAVGTLTTVGYGDIYPITAGGRAFTFLVLITGLGVVAVPTGLFASALAKARAEEEEAHQALRGHGGSDPRSDQEDSGKASVTDSASTSKTTS